MTGPARTNTTTAAEVLRRQVLGAVAGKCISGASAEAAADAVMDVIAGLLADPGTWTEAVVKAEALREAADAYTNYEDDRGAAMVARRWLRSRADAMTRQADAPAADDEGGQEISPGADAFADLGLPLIEPEDGAR